MINLVHYMEQHPELPKEMDSLRIIHVRTRQSYGRPLIYPECDTAKKFAKLLNVKSFNTTQISGLVDLGYIIQNH